MIERCLCPPSHRAANLRFDCGARPGWKDARDVVLQWKSPEVGEVSGRGYSAAGGGDGTIEGDDVDRASYSKTECDHDGTHQSGPGARLRAPSSWGMSVTAIMTISMSAWTRRRHPTACGNLLTTIERGHREAEARDAEVSNKVAGTEAMSIEFREADQMRVGQPAFAGAVSTRQNPPPCRARPQNGTKLSVAMSVSVLAPIE
jgi:hypothetical protein